MKARRLLHWLFLAVFVFLVVTAVIPIVRPLEFAHGRYFIQGFFPARGGPEGFHHSAVKDGRGQLIFRAYDLKIGPVAWAFEIRYQSGNESA